MIKEYFTDGLIGLAILLSLFRTDLIGLNINNLINYPEVQDIIQGQTAVYLPANFHSNSIHALSHPKLRDREALSVWFRNSINLPHNFHDNLLNDIEAFLVSGSQQTVLDPSYVNNQSTVNITEVHTNENIPQSTTQTLPEESANSFSEPQSIIADSEGDNTATTSSNAEQPLSVDVTFLFNNDRPFPNCNLTTEDLNLIELLWKQDVDLGVGKEVYDQNLREELERQRQLEFFKQQEERKARELEERNKQVEASKWLNQNFMRDGETGEWVKRQNGTNSNCNESSDIFNTDSNSSDDFLTLEAALDYFSANPGLGDFGTVPEEVPAPVPDTFVHDFQHRDDIDTHAMQTLINFDDIQPLPVGGCLFPQEDEVEQFFNTSGSATTALGAQGLDLGSLETKHVVSEAAVSLNASEQPLIQDVALPSVDLSDPAPELGAVTLTNSSVPPLPVAMNTSLDWDPDIMTFFNNLTALQQDNMDDIDLEGMEDLLHSMTSEPCPELCNLAAGATDSDPLVPANASLPEDFSDAFDGLEGATGGANYSNDCGFEAPYRKMSRLSDSSSDSGFSGKEFSSSLSSSSPSSSYYTPDSPSGSSVGNISTNSNDTENDPHGSRVLAQHIAHNHTYNTLPGHVPREVKKYAPKLNTKKGPMCRDAKRAQEMKIPLTIDQIVDAPVETFNDLLTKYSLTEEQLTLIRDIRRRGKNKLAAQNCRKRKVGVIVTLSDEMDDLHKMRDRLKSERAEMERETRRMKEKFGHLYAHIFQSLRDEHGQPYDNSQYSLQQSSDGNVFLVPRNITTTAATNGINSNTNGTTTNSTRNSEAGRTKKRRSDN